ncbi:MAG: class I SAM-dependent methyltransferase [Nitrospinae bacterium]|nr:class I SAM-dependent methyltransferase [Nitrospinota bacterium]
MNDSHSSFITQSTGRLPLVIDRDYLGLKRSNSPELARRVRDVFERLNALVGFPDSAQGRESQRIFNSVLRYAYSETLIDLADMIYVQHERPMVFLHFDHINANLLGERHIDPASLENLNRQMESLFRELAQTVRSASHICGDAEVVRLLGEGYARYIYETGNFPWEEPLHDAIETGGQPVLDVATGLAGFSLVHAWPESFPKLVLTDRMPFIVEGLSFYKELAGKRNVEIVAYDFSGGKFPEPAFGRVWANKFLHHLRRVNRAQFLRWASERLGPGGKLSVVDTDLEYRILRKAATDPAFKEKLIPGYLDTLVEIERDFCKNLVEDIVQSGLQVTGFDYNEYLDETDAYSQFPGDVLPIRFIGVEITAEKTQSL